MTSFQVVITGIELDGIQVKVPEGLSELLNSAKAWGVKKEKSQSNNYERRVSVINGKMTTFLIAKDLKGVSNDS